MRSLADLEAAACGVPPRFAERSLDGYVPATTSQTAALSAARRMVAGDIRSLVLVGPTGVGKTHLAVGVLRSMQRGYHGPMWCNVADLIVQLRLDMDRRLEDREASEKVDRMRRRESLVVLDDLGREKVTDWTGETIYALVNARYEAMLPTLVTSNLTAAELAASPYWPVISRLAEDGALVEVTAPDHRLRRSA